MVASKKTAYEELRKERLEENQKRMEQLKKLSLALRDASPKATPMKRVKSRVTRGVVDFSSVRRSSRCAEKPKPNYKDDVLEPLNLPMRSYKRRDLLSRVYASDGVRAYAIERAEQLQSTLDPDFPSFVKPMLQSHVTGGFWLGLPVHFCKAHLPKHDDMITVVDEQDEEFPTKFLAEKTGLSGGWRGFSIEHELVDGDALVFQLVTPKEFKVYIIRAYDSVDDEENEEKDGETDASNLDWKEENEREQLE